MTRAMWIGLDDPAATVATFYSGALIAVAGVLQQIAWATSTTTLGNFTVGVLVLGLLGYSIGPSLLGAAEQRGIITPPTAAVPATAALVQAQRTWTIIGGAAILTGVAAAVISLATGHWWWGIATAGLGIVMSSRNALTYRRDQHRRRTQTTTPPSPANTP